MGEMAMALPYTGRGRGQPRGRNRGRGRGGGRGRGRGRGRRPQVGSNPGGQPSSGISTRSGSVEFVRDTEILTSVTSTIKTFAFNPSPDELVRLKSREKMFTRYRFRFINIAYKSGSGTNVTGNVAMGIAPGVVNNAVKTMDDILKLRPSFYVPAWKNDSMSVSGLIDSQRFMMCGTNDNDGVSFTLYVMASAADLGMVQVSYGVEFAYPRPFQ